MLISQSRDSLAELIERFNRKERYIVFQQVATAGSVELDVSFRSKLRDLGWPVPDRGVLVLTDYHLNWLYAALELSAGRWASAGVDGKAVDDLPQAVDSSTQKVRYALEHNQEDIDLLLVWEADGETHLGLVEVKAHSGWSNAQLRSKAARLEAVLGREGGQYAGVVPRFALMSFAAPSKVDTGSWPTWMTDDNGTPQHVKLVPPLNERLTVGRVDSEGHSSSAGEFYGIRQSPS